MPRRGRTRLRRRLPRPARQRRTRRRPRTDAPAETTAATDAPAEGGLGEPNEATGEPITIGFVSDGADAAFGSDEAIVKTFESTIQYANEYLGGINGHPIEIDHCDTGATPAGGNPVRRPAGE